MGNFFSRLTKSSPPAAPQPKQYSWDKRPARDPNDFMVQGKNGETIYKKPGSIGGEQFMIDSCQDSNIYVMDNTATVTVDKCTNCNIFLAPIKSSVFIRNCSNCRFIVACQQFRTRDCTQLDVLLCCTTLPIIEASSDVHFRCFRGSYFELAGQFTAAQLSPFTNNWSRIHDFTPAAGSRNFALSTSEPAWLATFFAPSPDKHEADVTAEKSVVPITLGTAHRPAGEQCFVMLFGPLPTPAKKFFRAIAAASIPVVQTHEVSLKPEFVESFFGPRAAEFAAAARDGPALGIELVGEEAANIARAACDTLKTPFYISGDAASGKKNVDAFVNYVELVTKV